MGGGLILAFNIVRKGKREKKIHSYRPKRKAPYETRIVLYI